MKIADTSFKDVHYTSKQFCTQFFKFNSIFQIVHTIFQISNEKYLKFQKKKRLQHEQVILKVATRDQQFLFFKVLKCSIQIKGQQLKWNSVKAFMIMQHLFSLQWNKNTILLLPILVQMSGFVHQNKDQNQLKVIVMFLLQQV